MATADKFGNVAVVRLPPDVTDEVEEDPTGSKAIWDRGLLNGASQKVVIDNVKGVYKGTVYFESWHKHIERYHRLVSN